MRLLLTLPFTDESLRPDDEAGRFALLRERVLRELSFRRAIGFDVEAATGALALDVPARDAGDVCHVCGQVVSWVDHLPPLMAGGVPRCMVNVRVLPAPTIDLTDDTGRVVASLPDAGRDTVYASEFGNEPKGI